MRKNIQKTRRGLILSLVILGVLVLSACGAPTAAPVDTQDTSSIQTQAAQTVVADLTANAPPTQAPPPTAAPTTAPTEVPPPPGPTPDPNIPVAVVPAPASGEPAAIANYNTAIYGGPGTEYVVYANGMVRQGKHGVVSHHTKGGRIAHTD